MTTRGEQLASDFEAANEELITAMSGMNDEQWRRTCEGEGWTTGVTAHHVVSTREAVLDIVRLLGTSPGKVDFTPDMLNAANAAHATECADIGREETLELARSNGKQVAAELRAMDDEALAKGAEMFGREMTADLMVQGALIGHIHGHLESIQKAIA